MKSLHEGEYVSGLVATVAPEKAGFEVYLEAALVMRIERTKSFIGVSSEN
jgi:hypothetical protein